MERIPPSPRLGAVATFALALGSLVLGSCHTDRSFLAGDDATASLGATAAGGQTSPDELMTCLSSGSLAAFRSCRDLAVAPSSPYYPCRYLVRPASVAQLSKSLNQGRVHLDVVHRFDVTKDGLCSALVPAGSYFLTFGELAARLEKKYALPLPYALLRRGIFNSLETYGALPFGPKAVATALARKGHNGSPPPPACPLSGGSERLADWNWVKNFVLLGRMAEMFRNAIALFEHDPWSSAAIPKIEDTIVAIAHHVRHHANATDFDGLTLSNPFLPGESTPMGFNNLASSWDGGRNGTCSPPGMLNLYAQAHAIIALSIANIIRPSLELKSAIHRSLLAIYNSRESRHFNPSTLGSEGYDKALAKLSRWNGFRVNLNYSIGRRYVPATYFTDPTMQTIYPHYHADDPAMFVPNVAAAMAVAVEWAAKSIDDPKYGFQFPALASTPSATDGTYPVTGYVRRTLHNVAYYSMKPIYHNLAQGNASYWDIDDSRFVQPGWADHSNSTGYYLFRFGHGRGYASYRQAALALLEANLSSVDFVGACRLRRFSPALRTRCQQLVAELTAKKPNAAKTAPAWVTGGNPVFILWLIDLVDVW